MAKAMSYSPTTAPDTAAADEATDLVDAPHESGLLRAAAGAIRAYPQLLEMGLNAVDDRSVRAVLALGGSLRHLDPDVATRLVEWIRDARTDATAAAAGSPEGPLTLLRRLADPDTRRGVSASLAALTAIGRALSR